MSLLSLASFSLLLFILLKPSSSFSKSELEKDVVSLTEVCGNSTRFESCYSELLGKITTKYSATYAIAVLSEVQKRDPQARGCHFIAHGISIAETMKDLSKWKEVLGGLPIGNCSGGYIHGVIEAKQTQDTAFTISSRSIPVICDAVAEAIGDPNQSKCLHIMGHLAMVEGVGDIDRSLGICKGLEEAKQYECFSGVFMESETRENLVNHGISQKIPWNEETINQQEELCKKQTGMASKACWREIAHMYSHISHRFPPLVYERCSRAPGQEYIDSCYMYALGIMAVSSRFDDNNLQVLCQPYQSQDNKYRLCYKITLGALINSSVELTPRAINLCQKVILGYQENCYSLIGYNLSKSATLFQKKELCEQVPDFYKHVCLTTST